MSHEAMIDALWKDGGIFDAITEERGAQIHKWGPQSHPDGTGSHYASEADAWRNRCQYAFEHGGGTWEFILLEEVYEALAESDPAKLREELIQVMAVAAAWIQDIDSRG